MQELSSKRPVSRHKEVVAPARRCAHVFVQWGSKRKDLQGGQMLLYDLNTCVDTLVRWE